MFEVEDEMAGAELSAGIVAFCVEKLVLVIFVCWAAWSLVTGDHSVVGGEYVISLHNVNRIRVRPTKMGTCNRGDCWVVGGWACGWCEQQVRIRSASPPCCVCRT